MSALDYLFDEVAHRAVLRSHATLVRDARAELEQLRGENNATMTYLLEMVEQYCTQKTGDTYSHDFMSTGEGVFEYLVEVGRAEWCKNGVDICNLKFPQRADR